MNLDGVKRLSTIISWTLVLFNKFIIGKCYHMIVDLEKIPNKTEFNVSFAEKLSVALFINTAVITYVVEIIHFDNYYGPGGFVNYIFLKKDLH